MSARTHLILDIETIPDRALWTPTPVTDANGIVTNPNPFPPMWAHIPVVIGSMLIDDDYKVARLGNFGSVKDPEDALRSYGKYVQEKKPTIVTWNGRCFDLPVLNMRLLRLGVPQPWWFGRDVRYRFSENGHLDLMDAMTDYGAGDRGRVPLDGMSKLIGLPGKIGIGGDKVEETWKAGKLDEVREYCLCDVVLLAFLFLRWRLFSGAIQVGGYTASAEQLLEYLNREYTTGPVHELVEKIDRKVLLLA